MISLLAAVATGFILPADQLKGLVHIMLCWDVFALVLLVLNWITFFTTTAHDIRNKAKIEDSSRVVIFSIVLICTFASMLAVVLLLVTRSEKHEWKGAYMVVAIAGMVFSWLLMHSIYTIRYAHLYYANHPDKKDTHAGGLEFPEDDKPDFIDFAYFAFVLGMTFQVSDVQITSKSLRRMALMHGMLSFGFNTIIVALTINVLAGLSN
ncbi:Uncharacterized membrane protein [Filimonas lacunae]|uniref:Uncharacterized membrane protein n=2 Tax=Filimonas lacunae TaxID=477680 RepID=A0A173MPH1_9BACT|nr:transmembrane protein [Filimonas lacunae]SIS75565.1 Uncharacterized membrane protein [Filimonas lacunae]